MNAVLYTRDAIAVIGNSYVYTRNAAAVRKFQFHLSERNGPLRRTYNLRFICRHGSFVRACVCARSAELELFITGRGVRLDQYRCKPYEIYGVCVRIRTGTLRTYTRAREDNTLRRNQLIRRPLVGPRGRIFHVVFL